MARPPSTKVLQSPPWLRAVILFLAIIAAYSPVCWAGFIWDDDIHLTQNPCIVGPLGLAEIWTTKAAPYFPLVMTTFRLEYALWGLAPLPYHLVNVILHAGCAVILWHVLRRLQVPGAWLGAALWALHPVQVESVAWISEMKNTESCLFYLLTLLCFVHWLRPKKNQRRREALYSLSVLCAALALASKTSTVVLPAVLGLCAWWLEGRWNPRTLARLAPFVLMAVLAGIVTLWPGKPEPLIISHEDWARSWPSRFVIAGDAVWFYLGKLVWPHPLMFMYPRWKIDPYQVTSYLPLAAIIAVVVVLWRHRETRLRPCFFALSYFLVVLAPFLGLIDQTFWQYTFVEDHLQYLASMGPLALAGAGMVYAANFAWRQRHAMQAVAFGSVLLVLGGLSWQRCWIYENQDTLWTDTIRLNPGCWPGYTVLGNNLLEKGEIDAAIAQYQKGLQLNPVYYEAHNSLGVALAFKGQRDAAIGEFQETLRLKPDYAAAQTNLAKMEASPTGR